MTLHVRVTGRPAPQGSWDKGQHGQYRPASPYLKPWRNAVANATHAALNAAGWPVARRPMFPAGTAVSGSFVFLLGAQQPDVDLDKLLRSTNDALTTAKAWADDDQLTCITEAVKLRAAPGQDPGVIIQLSTYGEAIMSNKWYTLLLEQVTQDEDGNEARSTLLAVTAVAPLLLPNVPAIEGFLRGAVAEAPPEPAEAASEVATPPRTRTRRTKAEMAAASAPAAPPVLAPNGFSAPAQASEPAAASAPQFDPFKQPAGQ